MFRLVVTVFIVVLAQATFAIDFLKPKVVSLEFTEKDLKPGSYAAPHENSFVGDLVVGEIRGDEQFYTTTYEYENDSSWVVSLSLKLVINSGIINIINAQNLEDSRSVVCATADTLGKSESILSIRIPALSRLKLYVLLGAH